MQGMGVRVQTEGVVLERVDDILASPLLKNPALEAADAKGGSNVAAAHEFGDRERCIVRVDVERILNIEEQGNHTRHTASLLNGARGRRSILQEAKADLQFEKNSLAAEYR